MSKEKYKCILYSNFYVKYYDADYRAACKCDVAWNSNEWNLIQDLMIVYKLTISLLI